MPRLKSKGDLVGIYRSSRIAAELLEVVAERVKPGVRTAELDEFAEAFIRDRGGTPAFLNYTVGRHTFPASLCISINEEIVHGIPGSRELATGDIVTVDVGVQLGGYFCDTARTFYVGHGAPPPDVARLLDGTRLALAAGIGALVQDQPLRLCSRSIEHALASHHLAVIRELTGHGVGTAVHEEPTVYNFDPGSRRPVVQSGLVLAIEPMASLGSSAILLGADNWTYSTADGSLAAHFEHTVAVWEGKVYVLTDPRDEAARAVFG